MKRREREMEILTKRLTRLRRGFLDVLEHRSKPHDLVNITEDGQAHAWFVVGCAVTDVAELYRITTIGGSEIGILIREQEAGESPLSERSFVHWTDVRRHAKELRPHIGEFLRREIADFKDTLQAWRNALAAEGLRGDIPEVISAEAVSRVLSSLWELLIAADFCEQHGLLRKRDREKLVAVSSELIEGFNELPGKTRTGAKWFLGNFRRAVLENGHQKSDRPLAALAAKVLSPFVTATRVSA